MTLLAIVFISLGFNVLMFIQLTRIKIYCDELSERLSDIEWKNRTIY